jgi:hypothetical protein
VDHCTTAASDRGLTTDDPFVSAPPIPSLETNRIANWRLLALFTPLQIILLSDLLALAITGQRRISLVAATVLSIGAVTLELRNPRRRVAAMLAVAAACTLLLSTFPATANHGYLALIAISSISLARLRRPKCASHYTFALRALGLSVVFGSGVQKLLHGCYDQGEFFAVRTAARDNRFEPIAALLAPAERERLRTFGVSLLHAGPYRLRSIIPLAVSNATVAVELLLPALVCSRRIRQAAVVAIILFVTGIQVIAREITFSMLMTVLLSVWLRPRWQRRISVAVCIAAGAWTVVRLLLTESVTA